MWGIKYKQLGKCTRLYEQQYCQSVQQCCQIRGFKLCSNTFLKFMVLFYLETWWLNRCFQWWWVEWKQLEDCQTNRVARSDKQSCQIDNIYLAVIAIETWFMFVYPYRRIEKSVQHKRLADMYSRVASFNRVFKHINM